jgi:Ca2+/H+ antiporter
VSQQIRNQHEPGLGFGGGENTSDDSSGGYGFGTNAQPLTLGLGPNEVVLLIVTLILSQSTLGTGRTTVLQGTVHLMLFATFLFLAVVP